jgi:hypothetical protein
MGACICIIWCWWGGGVLWHCVALVFFFLFLPLRDIHVDTADTLLFLFTSLVA